MNFENCPESNPKNPPQLTQKSLIKNSVNLIGGMGMGIALMGLVNSEVQATGSTFVIPVESSESPSINPPSVNKPVKVQPRVKLSPPTISVPSNQSQIANLSSTGKNNYLDTNSYGSTVNQSSLETPRVILSERTTGCNTIVSNGDINNGNCGSKKVVPSVSVVRNMTPRQYSQARSNMSVARNMTPRQASQNLTVSNRNSNHQVISYRSNRNTIKQSYSYVNTSVERNIPPEYNHAARLKQIEANGNTALLFPLSIPSRIASTFGWRIHPITGSRKMHYGTDIAAPMGTPVLAAYGGEVAIADNLGGYGLTVILRHEKGSQESRYGHLSEIFVNQGEWVEQGSVIGLVGSTGFSTGPHLHFEWRYLTQQGWVAVDAGLHLQFALDNLIKSMETAKANSNSNSDSAL